MATARSEVTFLAYPLQTSAAAQRVGLFAEPGCAAPVALDAERRQVRTWPAGDEIERNFSIGRSVFESVAGAAAEQEDVRVNRMPVDDKVVIRRQRINTGFHGRRLGRESSEIALYARGELRGISVSWLERGLIGINPLTDMLVVTELEHALRCRHPVPSAFAIQAKDRQAAIGQGFVAIGLKPREHAPLCRKRKLKFG